MTPVQELLPKTDETQAKALLARVDGLLDDARNGRDSLHRTYVEIGLAIDEVEKSKAWMIRFRSFDNYVKDHCEPRFGKSRTQIYGAKAVAHYLLPEVTKDQLVEMGISKAMPLAQYTRRKGSSPSQDLINKALDPKIDIAEFRAAISEAQHEKPEKGKWYDFGGAFLTADEKIEMEACFELAETIEPLPEDAPDWLIRKIVMQRLVAEFNSTYAGQK